MPSQVGNTEPLEAFQNVQRFRPEQIVPVSKCASVQVCKLGTLGSVQSTCWLGWARAADRISRPWNELTFDFWRPKLTKSLRPRHRLEYHAAKRTQRNGKKRTSAAPFLLVHDNCLRIFQHLVEMPWTAQRPSGPSSPVFTPEPRIAAPGVAGDKNGRGTYRFVGRHSGTRRPCDPISRGC
jgi:hypothetical protein